MAMIVRVSLVIGLVGIAGAAVTSRPADNLIKNGSFEAPGAFGSVGAPAEWEGLTMGTFPVLIQDCTVAHEGQCSVKVMADKPVMTSILQTVKVEPSQWYRFSGWVRTEKLVVMGDADMYGTLLVLPNEVSPENPMHKGPNHSGQTDWTRVEIEFKSDATGGELNAICNFCGQGAATGFAWFDDVRLERIAGPTSAPNSAPAGGATSRPAASRPG